mgnify:FL=1
MKRLLVKIMILSILFQLTAVASAQQYFVVQKKGKLKNFKYISGDYIYLETKRGEFKLSGKITQINDTSLVINKTSEIGLNDIGVIFRPNGLIRGFSNLFFIQGGAAYFFIAGANALINNESPIIDKSTLLISGSMIVTGYAIKPFITRKLNVKEKWEVKILNFDEFKKE